MKRINKYEEFLEQVNELEDDMKYQLRNLDKNTVMHMIEKWDYDIERIIDEFRTKLSWKDTLDCLVLTDKMRELLDNGYICIHGRDRSLRPIIIMQPHLIYETKASVDDVIALGHFVSKYCIEQLFVPKKVENWVTLFDLENFSSGMASLSDMKTFVKVLKHHFYSRALKNFVLHTSIAIRSLWFIISPFVEKKTRYKTTLSGNNTHDEILELASPKQLLKRYGGDLEDVKYYWPPYEASNDYGFEEFKAEKGTLINLTKVNKSYASEDNSQFIGHSQTDNPKLVTILENTESPKKNSYVTERMSFDSMGKVESGRFKFEVIDKTRIRNQNAQEDDKAESRYQCFCATFGL